jgi:hypothetical protein
MNMQNTMKPYFVQQTGSHCKDVDVCLSFDRDYGLLLFLLLGTLKQGTDTRKDMRYGRYKTQKGLP